MTQNAASTPSESQGGYYRFHVTVTNTWEVFAWGRSKSAAARQARKDVRKIAATEDLDLKLQEVPR